MRTKRFLRPGLLFSALAVFASLESAGAEEGLPTYVPGDTYPGTGGYTEYFPGDLPLIISAPHGGTMAPPEIPDRTTNAAYRVVRERDRWTSELAKAIRTAAFERYGRYPHVIICNLARAKVDCNRNIEQGAQGNADAKKAWRDFHDFIEVARRSVTNSHGRGLYIDLHGQSHKIERTEIGYALPDSGLFQAELTGRDEDGSTVRHLSLRSPQSFTELVRGEQSLGGLLEKRGYPCVPSPSNPDQGVTDGKTNDYFEGGYNVRTYGTSLTNGGTIDAIQIECTSKNVRVKSRNSTPEENMAVRATFASNLVASLDEFLQHHLGMELSAAPGQSNTEQGD